MSSPLDTSDMYIRAHTAIARWWYEREHENYVWWGDLWPRLKREERETLAEFEQVPIEDPDDAPKVFASLDLDVREFASRVYDMSDKEIDEALDQYGLLQYEPVFYTCRAK